MRKRRAICLIIALALAAPACSGSPGWPAAPVELGIYSALGNTPAAEPLPVAGDLTDTTPPTGTVTFLGGHAIPATPDSLVEVQVHFVATDTENLVTRMRLSDDGVEWHEWLPYTTTRTIILRVPPNWVDHYLFVRYRDAAGNVSAPCEGEQLTEGM